jgi:hypothetical protein
VKDEAHGMRPVEGIVVSKVLIRKSVKAKRLDANGQPIGVHEYPVPAGSVVDDLFEENGNYHFAWLGHNYSLPAGQLAGAYKEVDD